MACSRFALAQAATKFVGGASGVRVCMGLSDLRDEWKHAPDFLVVLIRLAA